MFYDFLLCFRKKKYILSFFSVNWHFITNSIKSVIFWQFKLIKTEFERLHKIIWVLSELKGRQTETNFNWFKFAYISVIVTYSNRIKPNMTTKCRLARVLHHRSPPSTLNQRRITLPITYLMKTLHIQLNSVCKSGRPYAHANQIRNGRELFA